MKLRPARLLSVVTLMLLALPAASQAEALNDKSIRAYYKDADKRFYDKEKTLAMLEQRLEPYFVFKLKETVKSGDYPGRTEPENLKRAEFLKRLAVSYDKGKRSNYKRKIENILYADSKSPEAYVKYTAQYDGELNDMKGTKHAFPTYTSSRTCYDTLVLQGTLLRLKQSMCESSWVSPATKTMKGKKPK